MFWMVINDFLVLCDILPFWYTVGFLSPWLHLHSLKTNSTTWMTWEYLCILKTKSTHIEGMIRLQFSQKSFIQWIFTDSSLCAWYFIWLIIKDIKRRSLQPHRTSFYSRGDKFKSAYKLVKYFFCRCDVEDDNTDQCYHILEKILCNFLLHLITILM